MQINTAFGYVDDACKTDVLQKCTFLSEWPFKQEVFYMYFYRVLVKHTFTDT